MYYILELRQGFDLALFMSKIIYPRNPHLDWNDKHKSSIKQVKSMYGMALDVNKAVLRSSYKHHLTETVFMTI